MAQEMQIEGPWHYEGEGFQGSVQHYTGKPCCFPYRLLTLSLHLLQTHADVSQVGTGSIIVIMVNR